MSRLKKILLAVSLLAISMPAGLAEAQNAKQTRPVSATAAEAPFAVGERLSYDVSWSNFIVAGELTLETKDRRNFDGVDGFHVSAQAQSVGLVSVVVYKVNDVYESFINAATMQPFRAEKKSRRGKKREETSLFIDQQRHTARISDGTTIEIPPDTYDLAGLLYVIRTIDLTPGKTRSFNLIEDNKVYAIKVKPEAREKVTTKAGSYETVRISTEMEGGRGKSNLYDLKMYVTTDKRRLPVLITAEPNWGQVRVELTSATGTKKK